MTLTRADVEKLSAGMARFLGELRLVTETALAKIHQALALTIEQVQSIEQILRLEETRRTAREEPGRGLIAFRATWTPVCRN